VEPLILEFQDVSIQFYVDGASWNALYFRRVGYYDCYTLKAKLEMEVLFRNVGNAYQVYVVRSLKWDQRENALV